jgi:type IV secretion system protein VirD4
MPGLILGRGSQNTKAFGFAASMRPESGDLITYSGDGHLVTFAPTGTGKTSGPVISNALKHPGQLIVLDPKGEVHAATAEARRNMGQRIHVLDLRDGAETDSLNPLDLAVYSGTDPAAIARSFAAELIERSENERDRFWNDWAETMITGAVAWLLADNPDKCRLSAIFDLFTEDDTTYSIACMIDTKRVKNRAAKAAFVSYLQLAGDSTRPSVMGTALSHLRLFDSDLARKLTDKSTIDITALINGEPMSLYIIVPPARLTAYRPLLRIWLSGLILALTHRQSVPEHRTLMLCDEIGNLGRIDAFLTAATLMRSWGMTIWTFWQNASQLQVYGAQANTLVDNAGVIQVFGARNLRMSTDLANLVGSIAPQEILSLPKDEQILLVEGVQRRCKQARYYNDAHFAAAQS